MTVWASGTGSNPHSVGLNLWTSGQTVYWEVRASCPNPLTDTQTYEVWGAVGQTGSYTKTQGEQVVAYGNFTGNYAQTYNFGARIGGIYGNNNNVPDVYASVTVPGARPDRPAQPTLSDVTSNKVRINGTPPNNNGLSVDQYEFYSNITNSSGTNSGHIFDFFGLTPNTYGEFIYRAHNAAGWSDWSPAAGTTTLSAIPSDTVTARTSSSFTLQGEVPSHTALGDVLEWQHRTALPGGTSMLSHSGRTITRSGLPRATEYHYSVRLRTAAGWSEWSNWASTSTTPEVPTIAPGYTTVSVAGTSAGIGNLNITDNGGGSLTNVAVLYGTDPALASGARVERGTWADITLSGLSPTTTYYYKVQAYNSAGWGSYGPIKSFTTATGVPNDPAAPTASSVTNTTLTLNWSAPAMNGAVLTNYQWQWSLADDFGIVGGSGTSSTTTASVTGLPIGTEVYLRVRAVATPGSSGWSPWTRVRTTGVAPNGGMRTYALIGGTMRQGDLYAFIGGERRKLKPMASIGGTMQTE